MRPGGTNFHKIPQFKLEPAQFRSTDHGYVGMGSGPVNTPTPSVFMKNGDVDRAVWDK